MNKLVNKSVTKNTVFQPNVLSLLDFCKGLAIAWIFLYHYRGGWFGWQGVHIFIVLSGFGLTYSCLKTKDNIFWKPWYLKRAERILPAYWLVCLSGFLVMLCLYLIKGQDVVVNVVKTTINIILDIFFLQNLAYQRMFEPPTSDSLWFIPLIIGCYLVFPWLYHLCLNSRTSKDCLLIVLGVATVGFIYRAISIYWIDGFPVGFESRVLSVMPLSPLDRLPDQFPFQLQAPFGFFLARIAEFTLGMIGATLLIKHNQHSSKIFINYRIGITGLLIWLAGYALVFTGIWGWVFADFMITLGLILWVVNLAWICQQISYSLFLKISQLGIWSYYIFLTHHTFLYLLWELEPKLLVDNTLVNQVIKLSLLGLSIIGTGIASWLLMKFDKSRFSKLIIQKSIGRLLQ